MSIIAPSPSHAARVRASSSFWRDAFSLHGSTSPYVISRVCVFGASAALFWGLDTIAKPDLAIEVGPFEVAGAVLGVLLVIRTNAGYDRWWEARKLWGGIVNQSRNLAIDALTFGPADPAWRDKFVRWTAAFGHSARASLRSDRKAPELIALLGPERSARVRSAEHMPSFVARMIGEALREACDVHGMDRFASLEMLRQRDLLIDHIGGCERIAKSPLPRVIVILLRRFIVLFLVTLPFALLHSLSYHWLVPIITMASAYPILSLDQMASELQQPFDHEKLSHLPLTEITANLERDLLALLDQPAGPGFRLDA